MRRFTLLDGMIVIASIGVGLALVRFYVADVDRVYANSFINRSYLAKERCVGSAVCILSPLTFGSLIMRLRGGRWRRPGAIALVVASLFIAFDIASVATLIAYFTWSGRGPMGYTFYFLSGWWEIVGTAVLAAWLTMGLTGCWRGDADWVEHLGRLIGACWIAMLFVGRIASAIC